MLGKLSITFSFSYFTMDTLWAVSTDTAAVYCSCGSVLLKNVAFTAPNESRVARHSITLYVQQNLLGAKEGERVGVQPRRCYGAQGLDTSWSFHDIATVTWLTLCNQTTSFIMFVFLSRTSQLFVFLALAAGIYTSFFFFFFF